MATSSQQLEPLITELHEINREIADAARPLDRLEELDIEARKLLAAEIKARLARWELVTQKIHEVLEQPFGGA
jgi:transcription elongation GreA/GreB family factor